jgi:hypothetical protein
MILQRLVFQLVYRSPRKEEIVEDNKHDDDKVQLLQLDRTVTGFPEATVKFSSIQPFFVAATQLASGKDDHNHFVWDE